MIIVAKNKKNHYMIKNFIQDFNRYSSLKENYEDKIHPVFQDTLPGESNPVGIHKIISDEGDRNASKAEIEFVADQKPRYRKYLKKLLNKSKIIPFMSLVLLYSTPTINSNEERTAIEYIKNANKETPTNKVEDKKSEDVKSKDKSEDNIIMKFDNTLSFDHLVDFVSKNEGFRPTPYPDHKQWSIGYGSKVSNDSDSNISESFHNKIRRKYNRLYNVYRRSPNAESIQSLIDFANKYYGRISLPGGKTKSNPGKWYKDLHGIEGRVNLSDVAPISQDLAKQKLTVMLKNEIDRLKDAAKFDFDSMPADIQEALSDMAYNMGGGFIKKFKKLHKILVEIETILKLNEKTPSQATVIVLEDLFEEAAEHVKDSQYYRDVTSRAKKNIIKILNAIDNLKIFTIKKESIPSKNYKNESLKKVYDHLFV